MEELQGNKQTPLSVFISYAHEDEKFRKQLERHLGLLRRQRWIADWHDRQILAGSEWAHDIDEHLEAASIILLLISPAFLDSDYCFDIEMQRALERHKTGEAEVIPILLQPVGWQGAPFAHLQVLPTNARPITKWRDRNEAFLDIVAGIRRAISTLSEKHAEQLSDRFDSKAGKEHNGSNGLYHAIQSVFFFNAPLIDANEFYGRRRERATLLDRTYKSLATSIVGPRRIGKTWLMQYIRLVAPTQFGSHFRVAYIDATSPRCATVNGFVSVALEELGSQNSYLPQNALDLAYMERMVKNLKEQGYTLVLCIDEFEGLTNEDTFDYRFFTGLRAIAQTGLALVVASKCSLIDLVSTTLQTSPFFNIFEKLTLQSFSRKEAEMFVNAKSQLAGFDTQERDHLLAYGQGKEQSWPPVRLQLVGTLLLEEKTLAQQEDPDYYRPADPAYWRDFEKRLEEKYQEVGL